MDFLTNRIHIVSTYLAELTRHGPRKQNGRIGSEVLFVLDGIGGFQFGPLLVRRAFRLDGHDIATVLHRWQFGLVGEIFTDLMWYRRNRLMGLKFARTLLSFRRTHPDTRIHVLAYSGGAGIAAFACEALKGRRVINTLVLACPAISPRYNMASALRATERTYTLISRRDRYLLGIGTRLLGTTDRKFEPAAGMVGFRIPPSASQEDSAAYERMREIRWSPQLRTQRHHGGHSGWLMMPIVRRHLVPILRGEPLLEAHPIRHADTTET